jgi:prolyl-tRNA synthetase
LAQTLKRQRWLDDFSEWYTEILAKAEVYDNRYPVKGCGIWRPYGFQIRHLITTALRRFLDETGHEEILMPLLIPEDFMEKEAQHVKGFSDQVFWVTHGGASELEVKLALRPTSETSITPMLAYWAKSHADLPKVYYQLVSTFRYETKATRPLIRVRELSTFKEAHTAHASLADAERQVGVSIQVYKRFFDYLCLPYLVSKRPEWDKFAGANYTIAFDTIMPDGRSLQIGSTHLLGQNFSKSFNVTFETVDGKQEHFWQTSYGISERAIAALFGVHGDDTGLILPPEVAPLQVVVIPIPYRGKEKLVEESAGSFMRELQENGIRTHLDDREAKTPGSKYFDWEIRGVPLRVEIGPRDLEKDSVTLVSRDAGEKRTVKRGEALTAIREALTKTTTTLQERAWKWQREHLIEADSLEEAKKAIKERNAVAILWCGSTECGQKAEAEIDARTLGTPVEETAVKGDCLVCGKPATTILRMARAY